MLRPTFEYMLEDFFGFFCGRPKIFQFQTHGSWVLDGGDWVRHSTAPANPIFRAVDWFERFDASRYPQCGAGSPCRVCAEVRDEVLSSDAISSRCSSPSPTLSPRATSPRCRCDLNQYSSKAAPGDVSVSGETGSLLLGAPSKPHTIRGQWSNCIRTQSRLATNEQKIWVSQKKLMYIQLSPLERFILRLDVCCFCPSVVDRSLHVFSWATSVDAECFCRSFLDEAAAVPLARPSPVATLLRWEWWGTLRWERPR